MTTSTIRDGGYNFKQVMLQKCYRITIGVISVGCCSDEVFDVQPPATDTAHDLCRTSSDAIPTAKPVSAATTSSKKIDYTQVFLCLCVYEKDHSQREESLPPGGSFGNWCGLQPSLKHPEPPFLLRQNGRCLERDSKYFSTSKCPQSPGKTINWALEQQLERRRSDVSGIELT